MFGLLNSNPFSDPELGNFARSRGAWRAMLNLHSIAVPLAIDGGRKVPDPAALAAAREARTHFQSWRAAIEVALFEHAEPYAHEATDSPTLPADVWSMVTLEYVSIAPLDGILVTELGYSAAWDEEHTLGLLR